MTTTELKQQLTDIASDRIDFNPSTKNNNQANIAKWKDKFPLLKTTNEINENYTLYPLLHSIFQFIKREEYIKVEFLTALFHSKYNGAGASLLQHPTKYHGILEDQYYNGQEWEENADYELITGTFVQSIIEEVDKLDIF